MQAREYILHVFIKHTYARTRTADRRAWLRGTLCAQQCQHIRCERALEVALRQGGCVVVASVRTYLLRLCARVRVRVFGVKNCVRTHREFASTGIASASAVHLMSNNSSRRH